MDKEQYLSLPNDDLLRLFEENNYSLNLIDRTYGFSKSTSERLFKRRGINYNSIKEERSKKIIEDYNKNPKLCKHCGKPIPWDQREKDFCNSSCAASFNNKGLKKNFNYIQEVLLPKQKSIFINRLEKLYPGKYDTRDIVYINGSTKVKVIEKLTGDVVEILPETISRLIKDPNKLVFHKKTYERAKKLGSIRINHLTWDGETVVLRSSYESDYAELLDSKKIKYEVESLRLKYFDSQSNKNRIAIPDFYIVDTNTIVEIKSDFTLDIQEMRDRFKVYQSLGYATILILEHEEIDLNNIENLISPERLNRILNYNIRKLKNQ